MSGKPENENLELKTLILQILDENEVMAVATIREDGWPQATTVGYARDDLTLYFAVARTSQKLHNIKREPRISITLGHRTNGRLRGLSLAARAVEVDDAADIQHLNEVMRNRYPHQTRLAPREVSAAVIKASPVLISIVDLQDGPGAPTLMTVADGGKIRKAESKNLSLDGGYGRAFARIGRDAVPLEYLDANANFYRPGAPF